MVACASQIDHFGNKSAHFSSDPVSISVRSFDFQTCFNDHYEWVMNSFIKRGIKIDEAEELTQEVFLQIHKNGKEFRGDKAYSLQSWIKTISDNIYKNYLRSRDTGKRKGKTQSIDHENPLQLADGKLTPEQLTVQRDVKKRMAHVIKSMGEPMRTCVIQHLYYELPYKEIAQLMKLELHSVKNLLHRARNAIRDVLSDTP